MRKHNNIWISSSFLIDMILAFSCWDWFLSFLVLIIYIYIYIYIFGWSDLSFTCCGRRAKDRGARYDSHSPSRSLSLSPRDDKDCRSPRKSLSPRKNSRRSLSPREDSRRSLSPREDSRRSLSLRQNSRRSLSPERRNRRSLSPTWNSRRSLSPRENNRMSSSPREDGRSRSYRCCISEIITLVTMCVSFNWHV